MWETAVHFDIKSLLKSHFQHTKIFQNTTIHDIVPLMCTSCKKLINDQLLTLNKEVCNEIWKCIYRKKCHLTLTNNLDLHNFLIIIESGSQHTKLYIWGKSHALIVFWKLPLILAAKQLDYSFCCRIGIRFRALLFFAWYSCAERNLSAKSSRPRLSSSND